MSRIFKYIPDVNGHVDMPSAARILKVAPQGGALTIWAEVEGWDTPARRTFELVGTGGEVPAGGAYLDTVLLPSGLVWHVYEVQVC